MAKRPKQTQIVLFESSDGEVALDVAIDKNANDVWLSRNQIAVLFDRDVKTIGKHIANALKEELNFSLSPTVAKIETVQKEGSRTVKRKVEHYNLDVIISVGYRVKSQRGIEFRRWATDVLRRYIVEGRAENERRLQQLMQTVDLMERISDDLDSAQVLEIVKGYGRALDLLDDYDHQRVPKPKGTNAAHVLDYDECRRVIDALRFNDESSIFGVEKDESFKSSIAAIYQTFDGHDLYPSIQEKAAHLLYFIVKNHSFHDGNKRIAATLFLYFLDKNEMLWAHDHKIISDSALVATTIMIAESKPDEKEMMIALVMNFLVNQR